MSRLTERDSPLEVVVAVIERKGRYLITQRSSSDSFGGKWEFPGGKPHPGETMRSALAREIQEELGITIAVGPQLTVIEHRFPHRLIRLHCFHCQILAGQPRAIECAAWRWVAPAQMTEFEFPPASAPIIEALRVR